MACHILVGDCLSILKSAPDNCVQCCITSPPYFNLRDYGIDGQIGLEADPYEYINKLVKVFREVRRVLRNDGTLWLNLGDSFAANRSYQVSDTKHKSHDFGVSNKSSVPTGMKPKDLMGIPWRVAIALQEDGWYLRSDIIWAKGNPMPESMTDRPTRSHEYLFLLTKSPKYYYDYFAVREQGVMPAGTKGAKGSATRASIAGVNARPPEYKIYDGMRNKRSVWQINTRPFKGAHFAVFPPALVEPCLLAGTSEKGSCRDCGAPWQRIIQRTGTLRDDTGRTHSTADQRMSKSPPPEKGWESLLETIGWDPTCQHQINPVPSNVLDPFAGSGTVGVVAEQYGRDSILIELNPDYAVMAQKRIGDAAVLCK